MGTRWPDESSVQVTSGPWLPLASISPKPGTFQKPSAWLSIKRWAWRELALLPLGGLAAQKPPARAIEDEVMEEGGKERLGPGRGQLTPALHMHRQAFVVFVTLSWAYCLLGWVLIRPTVAMSKSSLSWQMPDAA